MSAIPVRERYDTTTTTFKEKPMATEDTITTCANCGKGEESTGDLKACTACKLVKYCNRDCQIAHRPLHKKACKKRAAELHDEALFKEHPPTDDCPICFLPIPLNATESNFYPCCGKIICDGCVYAMMKEALDRGKKFISENTGNLTGEIGICAFCRTPPATSDANDVEQIKKLMENGNAEAFNHLAATHRFR